MNDTCISRIYATTSEQHGRVNVVYIPAHTNHSLTIEEEAKHIPLPLTTRAEIATKLQQGISVDRIMEGTKSGHSPRVKSPSIHWHNFQTQCMISLN